MPQAVLVSERCTNINSRRTGVIVIMNRVFHGGKGVSGSVRQFDSSTVRQFDILTAMRARRAARLFPWSGSWAPDSRTVCEVSGLAAWTPSPALRTGRGADCRHRKTGNLLGEAIFPYVITSKCRSSSICAHTRPRCTRCFVGLINYKRVRQKIQGMAANTQN